MDWYQRGKQVVALRKHVMRADLHVHCGDLADFSNPNDMSSNIKSMLMAAIVKGLDVIGIVSHDGPQVGQEAQRISSENGYDLYVLSGQEYLCADKVRLIIYNAPKAMPQNLSAEQAIASAHQQKGLVMAIDLSKARAKQMNNLKSAISAPDAVEIYNAATGGYQDIACEFPRFISSASKSATELQKINVFTLVNRKVLEDIGFIPRGQGEDYEPLYLQRDDQAHQNPVSY